MSYNGHWGKISYKGMKGYKECIAGALKVIIFYGFSKVAEGYEIQIM